MKGTTVLTPELHKHYAKEVCANCGKFWTWLPNPKTLLEHELRKEKIDKILSELPLSAKEVKFLKDIKEIRNLSPRQFMYYEGIQAKYAFFNGE